MRQSIYLCARKQVMLDSISSVIGELGNTLFNCNLSSLSSTSTMSNMVKEMKVLSIEQTVSAVLESDYVNLCWDATTIDSCHLYEVHINTGSGSYVWTFNKWQEDQQKIIHSMLSTHWSIRPKLMGN